MSAETCVFAQLQSGALPTELSEAGCATRPRYFKMEARRRLRLLGPALVWASRSWGVQHGRTGVLKIGRSRLRVSGVGMGPEHADGAGVSMANESTLSDIVSQMREATMRESRTALMDEDLSGLSVPDPRILIVGCGGSGNNTLNRITHLGVNGASTVAINTDKQHLDNTRALQKLLVGRHITRGLGAGGDPATGRRCAEAGREMIQRIVSGADLVFIACGLGGGSGTGIAPVVAEEAKAAGALGRRHRDHAVPRRAQPSEVPRARGPRSAAPRGGRGACAGQQPLARLRAELARRGSLLHHGPVGRGNRQGHRRDDHLALAHQPRFRRRADHHGRWRRDDDALR